MRTRLERALAVGLALLAGGAAARLPAPAPKPLVVIDAGHGGRDPGARGVGGAREKDVTLAVSRSLAALLRGRGVYEVRLTRDADTLVSLRDRPRFANRWRGDESAARPALFLSIHCNSSDDASARGFETYFLSAARTEDARRVEEMENSAESYEADAGPDGDPLRFILHDLRQNLHLRTSNAFAAAVQRRLAGSVAGPDRGVKQAGFRVLDGAFMPAVLVEIGFLSHPVEGRRLGEVATQRAIAASLARAVDDHFAPDR